MKITYFGHSALTIQIGEIVLMIDPFISPNVLASDIDIDALKVNYILLTHAHQDHLADVERIAQQNSALKIISSFELVTYFENKGIAGHPMNIGGSWNFDFGSVKMLSAIHSSALPDGSYGGPAAGFLIKAEGKTIYISGDTALTYDMKLIPAYFGKPDLAVFPIGNNFTMDVNDAIVAADFVEVATVLGCHFDTFGYIKIDHEAAISAFAAANKKLILLPIGESIEL